MAKKYFTGLEWPARPNGNCCAGAMAIGLGLEEREGAMMLRDRFLTLLEADDVLTRLPWLTEKTSREAMETIYPGGKHPTAKQRATWKRNGVIDPNGNPTRAHHFDDLVLGVAAESLARELIVREVDFKRDEREPDVVGVRIFGPTSCDAAGKPLDLAFKSSHYDARQVKEGVVALTRKRDYWDLMQLRPAETR